MEAGAAVAANGTIQEYPAVVAPEGWKVASLEEYQDNPSRPKGVAILANKESFVEYVERCAVEGTSVIFASYRWERRIEAVFNYHMPGNGEAGWGDYGAVYEPNLDVGYQVWMRMNSVTMSQEEFAAHVEARILDFHQPPAAEMLSLAENFETSREMKYSKSIRQSDGSVSLAYENKEGAPGSVKIPREFTILLPIFQGEDPSWVTARLRHRLQEGKLAIWYEIVEAEKRVEEAFLRITKEVRENTGVPLFMGLNPKAK
jgi:uncharacterized protein YfdQ (DUF2303 family)